MRQSRFVRATVAAALLFLPALSSEAAPLCKTAGAIALSACASPSENIQIGGASVCGPNVYVDKSLTGPNALGFITIVSGGSLCFPDTPGPTTLETTGISLAGTLSAGSAAEPMRGQVVIRFIDGAPLKGISVQAGGSLQLYGAAGVAAGGGPAPSWTHLAAPAGPPARYGTGLGVGAPVAGNGATTLQLSDAANWQTGQWIVVAGTDFSPDSAEFVRIQSVSGSTVTLDPTTPLLNYHFGGPKPDAGLQAFTDTVSQNYGVDERAEVGLISRNIKLTATVAGTSDNGGEIMIASGFAAVALQGVEIEKFGKGKLGSYPIHFHQDSQVGSVLIDSNSIHHSYNKCVVVHATSGITVSNTVCARAIGNLFYLEEGTESQLTFTNNLGIGAMAEAFTLNAGVSSNLFWPGDYMTNGLAPQTIGYDAFNVPFTDQGAVEGIATTPSGFWITNLANNSFTGNDIAGCQGSGRGFWILPATASAATTPPAAFANNRAHGCYVGFDTASDVGITGANGYYPQNPCVTPLTGNCDVVAEFDGLTATRNRNRGIWVRAAWYALDQARLATNRDGVSLVSSGGTEGSPPGEWSLLRNAVVVGISANNPQRFGPCPYPGENGAGGNEGCTDAAVYGNGYPLPSWNLAGIMFYDGPARVENVRFVNFRQDISSLLTQADLAYLNYVQTSNTPIPCHSPPFVYEGDAALGWFQSNENSYPPTQYAQGLSFYNVDLRHQVYTQNVELTCVSTATGQVGAFRDGDKFTVILDRDASLTGLQVGTVTRTPAGVTPFAVSPVAGAAPISLNNLPFLAGPGTVDEVLATGAQDALFEGRPTSLISPYDYATLEFQGLTAPCDGTQSPNCQNNNVMVFTKDQKDYGGALQFTDNVISTGNSLDTLQCGSSYGAATGVPGHACVALSGRNGNGIYEPKLVNGLGYTVGAQNGMPAFVSLMYTDAHRPAGISAANPFKVRVGLCYKDSNPNGPPPATAFTITKGRQSFGQVSGNPNGYFKKLSCSGLFNAMCVSGASNCFQSQCPSSPSAAFTPVSSASALDDPAQCPGGSCYYYDQTNGLLFFNLIQDKPNAGGPRSSPPGSCPGTGGHCAATDFYSCPAGGCQAYTVQVAPPYQPQGPSACLPYGGTVDYTEAYPANLNQLAYNGTNTPVTTQLQMGNQGLYPHQAAANAPAGFGPANIPPTPDWTPAPLQGVFEMAAPPGVTATLTGPAGAVAPISGTPFLPLTANGTYTLAAAAGGGLSCSQQITINATGTNYTPVAGGSCNLPASASGAPPTISLPSSGAWTIPGRFQLGLPPAIPVGDVTLTQGGNAVAITNSQVILVANTTYLLSVNIPSPSYACSQSFTTNGADNNYSLVAGGNCGMPGSASGTPPTISVGAP